MLGRPATSWSKKSITRTWLSASGSNPDRRSNKPFTHACYARAAAEYGPPNGGGGIAIHRHLAAVRHHSGRAR
jgi:hypothetical protein